jgi:hypothetical protein
MLVRVQLGCMQRSRFLVRDIIRQAEPRICINRDTFAFDWPPAPPEIKFHTVRRFTRNPTASRVELDSLWLCPATCGKLSIMGNKDARRREVKKPPKKKPPKHVVTQTVTHPVYKPPAPKP